MNLLKNIDIERVMISYGAGTTSRNGDFVDMAGWDGVVFIALFGTIVDASVITLKAAQASDVQGSDVAELSGTAQKTASSSSEGLLVLDVYRPEERYVRPEIEISAQNAEIDGVIAIKYKGRKAPVSLHSDVLDSEVLVSPAEA